MPTTSLSAWSFVNQGPLTTVFTAPASCSNVANQLRLATVTTNTDTNSTGLLPYLGLCNPIKKDGASTADCIPSGKQIASESATIDTAIPTARWTLDYYSPGLYCPSGHRTVGVGANNAGTLTSSGDGFVPTMTYDESGLMFNPVQNILLQGLDRGETAVLCCPNSFQVDFNGVICFSPLPTYPVPSEVCYLSLPDENIITITTAVSIFGTAVTGAILQQTASVPITETVTVPITNTESYSVISIVPMITLIHNAADATAHTNPSATSTSKSGAFRRAEIGNIQILLLSCWVISLTTGLSSLVPFL